MPPRSYKDTAPSAQLISGGYARGAHRHRYSHLALGDSVHGTTHEGGFEDDIAGDSALGDDTLRREVDFPGQDEEVIVGETSVDARVHELLDGEAISVLVGAEVLQSGRRVEILLF